MLDAATLDRWGYAGLRSALEGGVDWLQLRDRSRSGAELLAFADRALAVVREVGRGTTVVINRRLDVALAAGADGVHLGYDALPTATARALLGPQARIGVSLHDPARVAGAADASYVHLAPVFPPLSKRGDRPPLGLAALRAACRGGVPVIAQGGIEAANAATVVEAGAAGVAVIGAIADAEEPGRAARALRSALDA